MDIIHFTEGATDPLAVFDATGATIVPLATGHGDTHLSCVHLTPGGNIPTPSLTHAAALLIVHGKVTVTTSPSLSTIDIHAGMGCVFEKDEPYSLKSDAGAILIILESDQLVTNRRGISTPERIAGQRWPGDTLMETPRLP